MVVRILRLIVIIAGLAAMLYTCTWIYQSGREFVDTLLRPTLTRVN